LSEILASISCRRGFFLYLPKEKKQKKRQPGRPEGPDGKLRNRLGGNGSPPARI